MNILYFLIPLALLLGMGFIAAFIWAISKGQFDDLKTPAQRILLEDRPQSQKSNTAKGVKQL